MKRRKLEIEKLLEESVMIWLSVA